MRVDDLGVHIHQSDLKNHCLEKLRLDTVAVGPRLETDAATVGTVLHAVIESELSEGSFSSLAEAKQHGGQQFVLLLEEYKEQNKGFAFSTFGTPARAVAALGNLVTAWYNCDERSDLLGSADKPLVEWNFDLPFVNVPVKKHGKKADEVPVYLAGTADLVWHNMLWDWKSAGAEYRQWEKQRWDRQPDVYTWAAHQSGLIVPDNNGLFTFEFKVFVRKAEPVPPQTITVKRSPNHWVWLEQIVSRLVNLSYNLGLDTDWPLDDQHVLCSPKWCSYFDRCKGAHVSGETWV